MFVRVKGKEPNRYLQIVENRREGKRTLQRSWPPWGGWTSWPEVASMPC